MAIIALRCPDCQRTNLAKHGYTKTGKQRYACNNYEYQRTFTLEPHTYPGRRREIKEQIIEMSLNGSGIRDISRTLHISTSTVINELKKKEKKVENVNIKALESINSESTIVEIYRVELIEYGQETQKAEIDEMQSFVGKKENKRWLWHAINHETGQVLAFVLGTRTDEVFLQLHQLLEPFGITRFYTDGLKTYSRHLAENNHQVSKWKMQKIERNHLTLRTRIKQLQRQTICFSKSIFMHDLLIGLFISKYEFGVEI